MGRRQCAGGANCPGLTLLSPLAGSALAAGQAGWLRRALSIRMNSKRQASGAAAAAAELDAAIAEATAVAEAVAEEATGQGDSKKARVDAD